MTFSRILPLAGVSLLAMTAALQAEDAKKQDEVTTLETVTIINRGRENVVATGGTVVSREELDRLMPTNVSELFSRQSSIAVSGGGGPSKRIHVFGMEQSNLAVTVDGVPQTATSWHHTGSSVVDPVFLKRVEVEAGAAAADSGFAAAAGAVRYETVGAKDLLEEGKDFGARFGTTVGSNGRGVAGNAAAYGRIGDFDWFVMAHGQNGRDYKDGDGKVVKGTEPAARNILAKLGYEFEDNRFELNYERSRDKADRLIKMNMGLTGDELHPLEVSRDAVKFSYTSVAPTDMWDPEFMLYYSENDYWRTDYQARTNGNMILNEDLYGGKIQNTFTIDPGKITAGIDFGQHDYHTDNYGNNDRRYRDFDTTQFGVFTQGRFEFDSGFNVSTGARYDTHRFEDWNGKRFSDSGASVNATVAYKFTDGFEVFAGASRTWLGYVIGDYGYVHARNNAFYTDPGFDTGTAKNLKVGANVGGADWNAGITLFDTRIDGLPDYGTAMLANDPDEYRSRGVTLNANYTWNDTTFGATYTHARVTVDGKSVLPNSGYFMPVGSMATVYIDQAIPDYNMKVGATLAWAGKISDEVARAGGFYDQPAYAVVNTYAEWTPPAFENVSLRLGIENLFDKQYFERSSFAASSNRGGIDPVYAPGRTFTLHAGVKF
ncbi:TonB-dependent receptor domain-containing protein [Shinella zoogloeoides]|uniref:TonB-dependent receptor n=1 Tax=Shinella zoogloeoides TaxID=352475 RepID=A0A6N8TEP5_SHIZO|nr:TonB-dependent receptor [Shinella zoogloeoides]MXO01121.1 TonB-dependent receptor [Shinella zoogloeoides]UEX84342.1 TonB-dependent receptor [Shinella zoogloeoides]